ncbi:MAG TPA: phosphomannomutase/phosphoglucomutase [Moraxellaceae bacterium]|nr:phosphomannomutase/phosphoglucomutase [Moraxellaceae bacterium]
MVLGKKKKAESGNESKPEKKTTRPASERRAKTPLQAGLPSLLAAVVLLLAVMGSLYYLVDVAARQQHDAMTTVYRQHYLETLDAYLGTHESTVSSLSDSALLPYVLETAESNTLTARYPGAVYARVVNAKLDPAVPNGLSFAHQDMVLRVAAGAKVTPEISFYEKDQVVTFARPVSDGTNMVGVLLLSMPFKPLSTALTRFAPEAGKFELVQRNGSERAIILTAGDAPEVEGVVEAVSPSRNPGWEVRFAPVKTLGRDNPVSLMVLGLGVVSVLLVGGLLLVMLLMLQKRLREDAEAMDSFCENYFRYGTRNKINMNFKVCASVLSSVEQYGAELRAGKVDVKSAEYHDELGDLSIAADSSALLGGAPVPAKSTPAKAPSQAAAPGSDSVPVPAEIFRAYDIRGVVGEGLTEAVARKIGLAIGSEAVARGEQVVVVGRDGRLSGMQMNAALIEGLRASGRDVIDVGMVPTPVLYFATKIIGTGTGVMITGSHNPGNYNGFKIMIANDTLAGDEIQSLRQRIETGNYSGGAGALSQQNVAQDYIDRVTGDIVLARPLRVVVDAGNGIAGVIAPRVLEAMGCEVVPLFCEVDGKFPNHHPDPSKPENLEDLMGVVAANNADIGIAFDGDGDRIGVVTASGKNIYPDRLMMLLSKHVLTTNPGADIIFDVKCTRDLGALISRLGGRPVMSKTGHSFIKSKLKETGAALAGEMSGHIFFNDRWFGFDDAIYAAGRLLEILSLESDDADAVFAEFPENPSTPEINIPVPDAKKFALVEAMKAKAKFSDANIITIDGLRVELPDAWGLVRASNTSPCIVARFEGRTPAALAAVQSRFRTLLASVDSSLEIPF